MLSHYPNFCKMIFSDKKCHSEKNMQTKNNIEIIRKLASFEIRTLFLLKTKGDESRNK